MKHISIIALLSFSCLQARAIDKDTVGVEKSAREMILMDIRTNLDLKNKAIDSTIVRLDSRVGKLDSVLKTTGNPRERIDKLVERVQVLEEKQKAIEQNEINVYEANYQSAMINLVSMDREIKPLILFKASKDFFNALNETSNPVNYEGFSKGFNDFKTYIEKVKDKNVTQKAVSEIIESTGNISFGIPIVGAYSHLLFSGMAEYVNTIGHKKRELKDEAEKMFAITLALSQFSTDKGMIENEWDGINQSLEEMQVYYDTLINRNLQMLGMHMCDVCSGFTKESDANKRYAYLTLIRQKAADYVADTKLRHPKEWKEDIYYQLMDVQSVKMRYGDITYRITHHINKYAVLINKYKTNKEIGGHVAKLDEKLHMLKATFDETFEPFQYVHAATQMYKVL